MRNPDRVLWTLREITAGGLGGRELGAGIARETAAQMLIEEKCVKRVGRGSALHVPTSRGLDLINALDTCGKEPRLRHLLALGAGFGRAIREVIEEASAEAIEEAPHDLLRLKQPGAATEVSAEGEGRRWLRFAGEAHHDPLLAPVWEIVGEDGAKRRLAEAGERDRWQAAAFRTLLRAGRPDARARPKGQQ